MPERQPQQIDRNAHPGPPGARWFIACVYIFAAVVFVAWLQGWGEKNSTTAAGPAPSHHTIMGSAASR